MTELRTTIPFRAGAGSPLVLLHGLNASWRAWLPVLPALQEHHDVIAVTLPGHRGGPPLGASGAGVPALADAVEAQLDATGIGTAHLAGNSLGGWLAIELARRGRALSVVALSPAGGWTTDRDLRRVVGLLTRGRGTMMRHGPALIPLLRRPRARRVLLRLAMERGDRIPVSELDGLLADLVGCAAFDPFVDWIRSAGPLAAGAQLGVPVRIAWGQRDRTIPWGRYGRPLVAAVPGAESITMPGVGHVPMYDDPGLVARTILDVTTAADHNETRSRPMTMTDTTETFDGREGTIFVRRWVHADPRSITLLVHGYGEHAGRYQHVAERLVAAGNVVYAPDHLGHGRSAGERALIADMEHLVDDLASVEALAREAYPGLPVAVLGHSMGGLIATRFVQRDHDIGALVLTGPVVGGNPDIEGMMALDPLPDVPVDPAILSRDPAVGEAYVADDLVYHGPFLRPTLEAIFSSVDEVAAGPGFGELPVLWIHGEQDVLAPLPATREAMERLGGSHVTAQVREGAQHEVLNEIDKDEVLDEVVAFLAGSLRAGVPAT